MERAKTSTDMQLQFMPLGKIAISTTHNFVSSILPLHYAHMIQPEWALAAAAAAA